MAGKYMGLYRSSSALPERLAQQIEGPSSSSSDPSLAATLRSMQTAISSLQADKEAQTVVNTNLQARVESLQTEVQSLRTELQSLQSTNVALGTEVENLRSTNAVLSTELRMLSAMKDVLVRKLLEECRNKCKQELTIANIPFSADDWNLVIDDPRCLTLLRSLGLRRDCGLQATQYGPGAHMQQRGDKAAHVITEDKSLYAELICSKEGFERQSLTEIYKFLFENSSPEDDAFTKA